MHSECLESTALQLFMRNEPVHDPNTTMSALDPLHQSIKEDVLTKIASGYAIVICERLGDLKAWLYGTMFGEHRLDPSE